MSQVIEYGRLSRYERYLAAVTRICLYAGMAAMVFVMVMTVVHGVGRYVFARPVPGLVDITIYLVIGAVYLVIGYTMVVKGHVSIGILVDRFSARTQAIIDSFTYIICLAVAIVAIWQTFVSGVYTMGADVRSAIVNIPKFPFLYVVGIGWGLLSLAILKQLVDVLLKWVKKRGTIIVVSVVILGIICLGLFADTGAGASGALRGASPLTVGFVGLVIMVVLLFLRLPIALALATVGFFGLAFFTSWSTAFDAIGTIPYSALNMYAWSTMPMFILMGYFADNTKIAEEFYRGVRQWIGHFRGGLAQAVILGNAAFGACTGNAIGAAVTFLLVSLPEMRKYGYNDRLTMGAIAGGSLLSNLIPPSMMFIFYGAVTQTSIGKLFIAGIIPGVLLMAMYIVQVYIQCRLDPSLGPASPQTTFKEKMGAGAGMWAIAILFVLIMGGIYLGLFTPTEAGAFGAFLVLALGLARRKLSWQGFKNSLVGSGVTLGMVGLLLSCCVLLNLFMTFTGVPQAIATFIGGITQSPTIFLLIVVAACFALGCFLDSLALLLLTMPVLFPMSQQMGVDAVHFGVVVCMVLLLGALTPPFGIVVYAMGGVAKDIPLFEIFRGSAPFFIVMVIVTILLVFFPQLSLFLPGKMFG